MLLRVPHGLAEIQEVFGDPASDKFRERNLVGFVLPYTLYFEGKPVRTATCHKYAVDHFIAALEAIATEKLTHLVQNYSGIYCYRPARGKKRLSTHAWGIAIDLEAESYPLGSNARFPDEVVTCFTRFGFTYGGDFTTRKDPMHFQLCSGY